jgi:hypothetical protein
MHLARRQADRRRTRDICRKFTIQPGVVALDVVPTRVFEVFRVDLTFNGSRLPNGEAEERT